MQSNIDAEFGNCLRHTSFECLVQATYECLLCLSTTSVDCNHMIATGQEAQAARLIKLVAGQVKMGVVAMGPDPLEQVEIEVVTRDLAGDV